MKRSISFLFIATVVLSSYAQTRISNSKTIEKTNQIINKYKNYLSGIIDPIDKSTEPYSFIYDIIQNIIIDPKTIHYEETYGYPNELKQIGISKAIFRFYSPSFKADNISPEIMRIHITISLLNLYTNTKQKTKSTFYYEDLEDEVEYIFCTMQINNSTVLDINSIYHLKEFIQSANRANSKDTKE